jgi:hypothetical protein
VRSLTDAEAAVIAALLAARPERERERLRQLGIPRSTYYAVRRRAYIEGWLKDRYVPDPACLGRPYATFVVARPFAERVQDLAHPLPKIGIPTILWASPQLAFAVLFHAGTSDAERAVDRWKQQRLIASEVSVMADVRGPSVPVFFDFEGAWDHMARVSGTLAYPHGLGGRTATDEEAAPLTPHTLWALSNLLSRPFRPQGGSEDGHQTGVFGLPFSERRLLTRGWVSHRVLLNPSRVPAYPGRAGDRVFLIVGTPKTGARPEALFARLTRECRVFPYLYVVGHERWLIGALGGEPSPPGAEDDRRERVPVLPTLAEMMEGIEIFQEPLSALTLLSDHRYDLLVSKRGPDAP